MKVNMNTSKFFTLCLIMSAFYGLHGMERSQVVSAKPVITDLNDLYLKLGALFGQRIDETEKHIRVLQKQVEDMQKVQTASQVPQPNLVSMRHRIVGANSVSTGQPFLDIYGQGDKTYIVYAAPDDKAVRLWDASTGTLEVTFAIQVYTVCPLSNGNLRHIVCGNSSGLFMWDIATKQCIKIASAPIMDVHTVTLENDYFIVLNCEKGITVMGARGLCYELPGEFTRVYIFKKGDTAYLVCATKFGYVEVRDIYTGKRIDTLAGHGTSWETSIYGDTICGWSDKNGDFIATGKKNEIKIWNLNTGSLVQTLSNPDVRSLFAINMGEHSYIIAGNEDASIKIYQGATGKLIYSFVGHGQPVVTVRAFVKNSVPYLVSASTDGIIKVWDVSQVVK